MTDTEVAAIAARIQNALGCSKGMAIEYAHTLAANPEVAHGKIAVRNEDNRIIAYVPASVLEG